MAPQVRSDSSTSQRFYRQNDRLWVRCGVKVEDESSRGIPRGGQTRPTRRPDRVGLAGQRQQRFPANRSPVLIPTVGVEHPATSSTKERSRQPTGGGCRDKINNSRCSRRRNSTCLFKGQTGAMVAPSAGNTSLGPRSSSSSVGLGRSDATSSDIRSMVIMVQTSATCWSGRVSIVRDRNLPVSLAGGDQ
jgi:hypothetical protein